MQETDLPATNAFKGTLPQSAYMHGHTKTCLRVFVSLLASLCPLCFNGAQTRQEGTFSLSVCCSLKVVAVYTDTCKLMGKHS